MLGPVDVIINCAAISSPAACEKDVGTARCVPLRCLLPHVELESGGLRTKQTSQCSLGEHTVYSFVPELCCFPSRSLNVPSKLLDALDQHKAEHSKEPLLIQLSTDQASFRTG